MRNHTVGKFVIAALLAGLGGHVQADLLVRNDGSVIEGNIISQDADTVSFRADGSDTVDRIDRAKLLRALKTDDHGALLTEASATTMPTKVTVPLEPAAPPIAPSDSDKPTYYLIPLHGEVGSTVLASALEKSFEDAIKRKPTVVVLDIDSPGGLVLEAQKIIKVIHRYNKQLRIVALTDQDLSAAAIFSLSVKRIYVKSSSTIGAATSYQPGNLSLPPKLEEKMQSAWRAVARNSAEEGGHEPLLAEAMIDNDLELHLESAGGKLLVKVGSGDTTLCRKGKILTLSSREAIECGLAAGEADDVNELGTQLKFPGWTETKGLGTRLADYLPQKADEFKKQSEAVLAKFERNIEEARASDPTEVISRVVRTVVPMPMDPRFPMGPRHITSSRRTTPSRGGTSVVTTISHDHWRERSLACVVSLQQAELNLGEEASLCEAFGQEGSAEAFRDARTEIGAVRGRIFDDRDKYLTANGSSDSLFAPGYKESPTAPPAEVTPTNSPSRKESPKEAPADRSLFVPEYKESPTQK